MKLLDKVLLIPEVDRKAIPEAVREAIPEAVRKRAREAVREAIPEVVREATPEAVSKRAREAVREAILRKRAREAVGQRAGTLRTFPAAARAQAREFVGARQFASSFGTVRQQLMELLGWL